MPRQKTILLYQFDELSDKAKEKARDWYRDGALDYEWWDATYEDAKNIGLKITSFDLSRSGDITGKFDRAATEVAETIIKDHGEGCETRTDAADYLRARAKTEDVEKQEQLDEDFLRTILIDYHTILQKESEYLTSDEQVDESIRANEYEFNKDGSRARE